MESDEMEENVDINVNPQAKTFSTKVLYNKRIWKWICFYSLIYFSSRKIFDPWYRAKSKVYVSNAIQPLSSLDTNQHMIEGVIGTNSHKPSSNVTMLINHIILNYFFFFKAKPNWKAYIFPTEQQMAANARPDYKNNDFQNNYIEIHIAVWSFLIFVDVYNCYIKRKINTNDKMMISHHVIMAGLCLIAFIKGNFGLGIVWGSVLAEHTAIFATVASLLRVIYQKKRRDLMALRYISDLLFFIHGFFFTYARIKWNSSILKGTLKYFIQDEYNQFSFIVRVFLGSSCILTFLGNSYWIFLMWKVMGRIAVKMIKDLFKKTK